MIKIDQFKISFKNKFYFNLGNNVNLKFNFQFFNFGLRERERERERERDYLSCDHVGDWAI